MYVAKIDESGMDALAALGILSFRNFVFQSYFVVRFFSAFCVKIDESGMDALAALGIVLPITLIIQAFANLVGLGGAPRASMKLGAGDEKAVSEYPCAVINGLSPCASNTNTVPEE